MELRNITQYNPEYRRNGTLIWRKIGEKVGNHIRAKKQYPYINLSKINIPNNYKIDEDVLQKSHELYEHTHEMIPVYLAYDFTLISGFEQYELAKELGLPMIPMQRVTKMNTGETKQFSKSVSNRKIGNKKYPVKAIDGSKIFLSLSNYKKVKQVIYLVNRYHGKVEILPNFTFAVQDRTGTYIAGSQDKGVSLASVRRHLDELVGKIKGSGK